MLEFLGRYDVGVNSLEFSWNEEEDHLSRFRTINVKLETLFPSLLVGAERAKRVPQSTSILYTLGTKVKQS
jgi:hypothetical protein